MFRTTLTVLFAALTLSVPAFAQKGATGQDATQTKPLAELKETEGTWEEVPVVVGTGSTKPLAEEPAVVVLERRAAAAIKVIAEPIEYPRYEETPAVGTTDGAESDHRLDLKLGLDGGILHADLFASMPKFFGGVLLSLDNEVLDFGEFGMTLLRDSAVMGLGFGAEGHLALKVPVAKDLGGLEFYGQAVIADGYQILVGKVVAAIAN